MAKDVLRYLFNLLEIHEGYLLHEPLCDELEMVVQTMMGQAIDCNHRYLCRVDALHSALDTYVRK